MVEWIKLNTINHLNIMYSIDIIMIIENPSAFRDNVRNKINVLIKNNINSANLEIGVYNYSLKEARNRKVVKKWNNEHFVQIYVDRLRTIYINLKNPNIISRLQSNTVTPQIFAKMTHYEMCPEKWDDLIAKKIERDKTKYDTQLEAATDTFTCKKCKSNKCTYYQMQTRSADEPMTTFVTCIECGARWKC
jgi:transcription elongation factor S-II